MDSNRDLTMAQTAVIQPNTHLLDSMFCPPSRRNSDIQYGIFINPDLRPIIILLLTSDKYITPSQDFVKLYSNALATVSDKTYLENKNIVNRNRAANLTHNIHSAYYSLRGFSMFKNEMQNGRNENEYRSYADQTN
jgi:hypothetical protein